MKRFRSLPILLVLCVVLSQTLLAGPKDPILGSAFESFKKLQNVELQSALRMCLPENRGYIVLGPLDPRVSNPKVSRYYQTVRVICPNLESQAGASNLISANQELTIEKSKSFVEEPESGDLAGYRGVVLNLDFGRKSHEVQLLTLQQMRFLVWAKDNLPSPANPDNTKQLKKYGIAVSDYLYLIDNLKIDAHAPKTTDFNLPDGTDFYARAPDYVIEGYKNYKDYLFAHAEVVTGFTQGVLGFVPTKATLVNLKTNAPKIAYPNKEAPLLQEEFKKFVERGGDMSSMRTLTKDLFDSLEPGEYFFAVGLNGNVRFGRELTREEVSKIEETGKKPARANHAFLFPGEPIMTAGAFFIGCDGPGNLTDLNTQSGHYFYSNITSTIKEDIADRSDSYFITIGHLLNAFDNLEINYDGAVISKL